MKCQYGYAPKGQQDVSPGQRGDKNALKGQRAISPGRCPGYDDGGKNALKGQKICRCRDSFALSGRANHLVYTQGVALG